jgi:hypothetical protein
MRASRLFPLIVLAVAGCKTYNHIVPHDTPVMMADEGRLKTFRPVDIDYSPAFSSRHVKDTYLIPDQVRRFDKDNADWAVSFAPEWNRSAAWDAARWVSHGQPTDLARWVISGNPTVVALGPHPANSQPGGIRPVTLNALENRVVRVVVLDRWQTPPNGVINSPPPGVRAIDLPERPTLRELFQLAPWAK